MITCTNCHAPYPQTGTPYRCIACGSLYDYADLPTFDPAQIDPTQPGIWRYRHTFGLPATAQPISLGEGNTPLVWDEVFEMRVAFKCEMANPSGAYKDRGMSVLFGFLRTRGVQAALEDSSGNAGAAFAAYAARANIAATVLVPASASGPKRRQIEAYGATLLPIEGTRTQVAEAARTRADSGMVYGSHAYMPFVLTGYATLAYELYEQMGGAPGSVLLPAGQGGLLLGVARGFEMLRRAGLIARVPPLFGVQAEACAPLWALFTYGRAGLQWVSENPTAAEGVRVRYPLRGDAVLRAVASSNGKMLAVREERILSARDQLARRGLYVEPTSALVWDALEQLQGNLPQPVAVVLTGAGLKSA